MPHLHPRRAAFCLLQLGLLFAVPASADVVFVRGAEVSGAQELVDAVSARLQVVSKHPSAIRSIAANDLEASDDDVVPGFQGRTRRLTPDDESEAAKAHLPEEAARPELPENAILVAVGPAALRALVERQATQTVLAALVSRSDLEEIRAAQPGGKPMHIFAIVTNQPARRQLALIAEALPHRQRIGVVYPPDAQPLLDELTRAAAQTDFKIVARRSVEASTLKASLDEVLPTVDLLLLLADPVSLEPGVAQTMLRAAAAAHKPVVASTEASVRAGALIGVFTTRADLSAQLADAIARLERGEHLPAVSPPEHFSVDVNQTVASVLDLQLPSGSELQQRLQDAP